MKNPDLTNKKFLIVSHIFADGPAQALIKYLTKKNVAKEVVFIGHPLLPVPGEPSISFLHRYVRGKKIEIKTRRNFGHRFSLHYLENFFTTIWWVLKRHRKSDVFIGANNLNAFAGIILKLLGRVKKVIFYCVDYTPQRFGNPIVNSLYHFLDKLTVYFADEIWNLSPRMVEARKKYKNLEIDPQKSKIVPMGVWFNEIKRVSFAQVEKHSLVFMGHLLKKQGVQFVIKAIPKIIKIISDFKFIVIGKGEYEEELKKIVAQEGVEKQVLFKGYIKDHEEMENLITKCGGAVALYEKGDLQRNFTYYADPGKIKDYLGAGLPIIMTDVPWNAREIEKRGCGVIVDSNEKDIVKAIERLMKDEGNLKEYRREAIAYAKEFDWNEILNQAFGE